MPKEIIKILGQVSPAAATETVLYTVPVKRSAVVRVTALNLNAAGVGLADVAIVPNGGGASSPATTSENYLIKVESLAAGKPYEGNALKGITLSEFDEIRVLANSPTLAFSCFGMEIEP